MISRLALAWSLWQDERLDYSWLRAWRIAGCFLHGHRHE